MRIHAAGEAQQVLAVDDARGLLGADLRREARELAVSHTGALAGEDDIADVFLAECGIARVDTLEGLIEGFPLLARVPAPRTAVITGWAVDSSTKYRARCDAAFPLSDHAGFDDLLTFVERVQPKRILTLHGFAREFAATLRERGWDALAIGQGNQLEFRLSG